MLRQFKGQYNRSTCVGHWPNDPSVQGSVLEPLICPHIETLTDYTVCTW